MIIIGKVWVGMLVMKPNWERIHRRKLTIGLHQLAFFAKKTPCLSLVARTTIGAPFVKWWQKWHPGLNTYHSSITLRTCLVSPQEWAYYLRINPNDDSMLWLVRAMMETELPKPWTCYKALGGDSIPNNGNSRWFKLWPFYTLFGSHLKISTFQKGWRFHLTIPKKGSRDLRIASVDVFFAQCQPQRRSENASVFEGVGVYFLRIHGTAFLKGLLMYRWKSEHSWIGKQHQFPIAAIYLETIFFPSEKRHGSHWKFFSTQKSFRYQL